MKRLTYEWQSRSKSVDIFWVYGSGGDKTKPFEIEVEASDDKEVLRERIREKVKGLLDRQDVYGY